MEAAQGVTTSPREAAGESESDENRYGAPL